MIQLRTCMSVHCDQCGDILGCPEFEARFCGERAGAAARRVRLP
jgi:hypothetical protein